MPGDFNNDGAREILSYQSDYSQYSNIRFIKVDRQGNILQGHTAFNSNPLELNSDIVSTDLDGDGLLDLVGYSWTGINDYTIDYNGSEYTTGIDEINFSKNLSGLNFGKPTQAGVCFRPNQIEIVKTRSNAFEGFLYKTSSCVYYQKADSLLAKGPFLVFNSKNITASDTISRQLERIWFVDFDHEGIKEIVAKTRNALFVCGVEPNAAVRVIPLPVPQNLFYCSTIPELEDGNNDGFFDVFLFSGDSIFVLWGQLNTTYRLEQLNGYCRMPGFQYVRADKDWVQDFDRDGKVDLILRQDGTKLSVSYGNGINTFSVPDFIPLTFFSSLPQDDDIVSGTDGSPFVIQNNINDSIRLNYQNLTRQSLDPRTLCTRLLNGGNDLWFFSELASINQDLLPDLVLKDSKANWTFPVWGNKGITVFFGSGSDWFNPIPMKFNWPSPHNYIFQTEYFTMADIDHDGIKEGFGKSIIDNRLYLLKYHGVITANNPSTSSLTLHPIPAHSTLHLTLPKNEQAQSATLIDALGQSFPTSLSGHDQISLKGIKPGLYTVQISTQTGKRFSSKLVVE